MESIPNKEILEQMMSDFGSMGKVAAELGRSYSTVRAWFNKFNLDRPLSSRNIFHELRETEMSAIQKSIVLGSILGDGCLHIPKHSKNAILTIKHCEKQRGYLKWKYQMLRPFSRGIYRTTEPGPAEICGVKSYDSGSFATYTMAHPNLTEFYYKYYKNRIKSVHKSIIEDLDLVALAVWVADDGTFYTDKKFTGVFHGKICTNNFTYDDVVILSAALGKFYNDSIKIYPHNKEKTQFVLKMTNSNAVRLMINSIKEILPKCIHYKLDPQRLYAKLL